jgi:hypothetical protein
MRTVVFLLLLANLSLFAYTRLDSLGAGEGVRLTQQVQPDKIRILSPQQFAALDPAKVASTADVCAEWGPFADADRARALAGLDGLQLGRLLSQRRQDNGQTRLVVRDPQQATMARLKTLQGQFPGTDLTVGTCPAS